MQGSLIWSSLSPPTECQMPSSDYRKLSEAYRDPRPGSRQTNIWYPGSYHIHGGFHWAIEDNRSSKANIMQGSLIWSSLSPPPLTPKCGQPGFSVWFPKINSNMNVSSTSDIEITLWRTWALTVTHEACEYTEQKFNAEKTGGDPVIPSPKLDTDLVMACDRLVDRLIKAYKNPSGSSCRFGNFVWSVKLLHHSSDADRYCKI